MTESTPNDDRFDQPEGWALFYRDDRFEQRFLYENGRVYCETVMRARCTVEEAVNQVRGPWSWWTKGQVKGFRTEAGGSSCQTLAPIWWFIVRVGLKLLAPVDLPGLKGTRVPIVFSDQLHGTGSMDVYPGSIPGEVIIRSRFNGVECRVPGVPGAIVGKMHLRAESSSFNIFPLPKISGWVGLYRRLEGIADAVPARRFGWATGFGLRSA
jgi:hypothetical protein